MHTTYDNTKPGLVKHQRQAIQAGQIKQILADAYYLKRLGVWPEVRDRLLAAADDFRRERRDRTIGDDLTADFLADDVAKVTGLPRDTCRAEARELLQGTIADAVAIELRVCVADYSARRHR